MGVIDTAKRWLRGLTDLGSGGGPRPGEAEYVCTSCRRELEQPYQERPHCGGIVVPLE